MNRNFILAAFFLSGFAALAYEIVWTRLFYLFLGATTYSFSAVLVAFFIGIAAGSFFVSRRFEKIKSPASLFVIVDIFIGISAVLTLFAFNLLDEPYLFFHSISNSYSELLALSTLLVASVLIIPAALMGMTLPLAAKIFSEEESLGRDIGKIFSINVFGGIFGSLAAGFVMIPTVGHANSILIAAVLNIVSAAILFFSGQENKKYVFAFFGIAAALIFFTAFYFSIDIEKAGVYHRTYSFDKEKWEEIKSSREILMKEEGVYGFISVEKEGEILALKVNGKTEGSTDGIDMIVHTLLGYVPLLALEKPSEIFHVGLGTGITLGATADFSEVEKVRVVEINPAMIRASKFFNDANENATEDARVEIINDDARTFLLLNKQKYDAIISEPSDIWISGEVNLFTKEFYEIAKSRLKEKGIFAQWIPVFELGTEDTKIALKTLNAVFPRVKVFSVGGVLIVLGSNSDIDIEKFDEKIKENPKIFENIKIISNSLEPGQSEKDFLKRSFRGDEKFLASIEARINSDDFPILEFATAANNAYLPENEFLSKNK